MAAITTAAAGNWSATGTWTGGVVPGNGDTVTLNHDVVVDVDTVIGTSPAAWTAVVTIGNGKKLTVASGVTFRVKGDLIPGSGTGTLILEAGSTYLFDSSEAAGTPVYKIRNGSANLVLKCNGTSENRVTVDKFTGSGNGMIGHHAGTCNFDIQYTDFFNLNDLSASNYAINILQSSSSEAVTIQHCKFTTCGRVAFNVGATANLVYTRNEHVASASFYDLVVSGTVTATGARDFKDNVFYASVSSDTRQDNFDWSGCYFGYEFKISKNSLGTPTVNNIAILSRRPDTNPAFTVGCGSVEIEDSYFHSYHVSNPHYARLEQTVGSVDYTMSGCVYETSGGSHEADFFLVEKTSPGSMDIVVTKNLMLPNDKGENSGSLLTVYADETGMSFTADHNTLFCSGTTAGASHGISFPENPMAAGLNAFAQASALTSVKSNIAWAYSNNTRCSLLAPFSGSSYGNQDSGTATLALCSSNQIGTTGKTWGTNVFITGPTVNKVKITSGTGAGQIRTVTANTSTQLTVSPAWDITPDGTSAYIIYAIDIVDGTRVAKNCVHNGINIYYYDEDAVSAGNHNGYGLYYITDGEALGQTDVNVDPQFVDATRNIATWASAGLGYSSSSVDASSVAKGAWSGASIVYAAGDVVSNSNAAFYGGVTILYRCILGHTSAAGTEPGSGATRTNWSSQWEFYSAYLLRQNIAQLSGYNASATTANMLSWIKAGFAPTNAALLNAGHDGVTIGAVEYVSADETAPVISSISASATGTTTATLTVTTDEGNGSIFFLLDANATATEAAILAGLSQSVTATGEQTIEVSALDASTAYYAHVLHRDAASNVSNILHSSQFTTDAYVYPVVSAIASAVSATEVSATATTTKAGGTISAQLTTSATAPDASDIIADPDDMATATDAGEYSLSATGLTYNTQYYWHIVHVDGEGLESSVITVPVRTLDLSITLDFPDTAPCSLLGYQVWSKLTVTDEEIAALWSE